MDTTKQKEIIRIHYNMNRLITDTELRDEIVNLYRKHDRGSLDDSAETLYVKLHLDR